MRLSEWNMGIAMESPLQKDMRLYLWFYEWNMFEAVQAGEHTHGTHLFPREISDDGTRASIRGGWIQLDAQALDDGASLTLRITNESDHDWSELAGIIPCFNPGNPSPKSVGGDVQTGLFVDEEKERTWFLGAGGLERLPDRAIHFNERLRPAIDRMRPDGNFVFSEKWPTSPRNARAGLIVRESSDGKWVGGVAWEDFLSAQGHNPWKCMHLCVRVGPLKRSESRTIRGRLYLFPGSREDCLERFQRDFPS